MGFDLNKKVRWENLTPSLQSKFKWLDTQLKENYAKIFENTADISRNNNNIILNNIALDALETYLNQKLNELKTKISNIKIPVSNPWTENTTNAIATGYYGQVAKIDGSGKSIMPHDNFEQLKVVNNQTDYDAMANIKPITLEEVFYHWYRFCHSDHNALSQLVSGPETEYGTWQNQGFLDIWSYNPSRNSITQNVDWSPVCGFINPTDFYNNYYLRLRYITDDDDNVLIFVGFMRDANGIEHTLSVLRGACANTCCYWAFVYDAGNPTQHKLIDYTRVVGSSGWGTYYISVRRMGTFFEFKATPVNDSRDNEVWTMRWGYPNTKPDDMTNEEYYNIGVMVKNINRIGFGVRSMCTEFFIDQQQYIFDDDKIYRLDTDEVFLYDARSGTWQKIGRVQDFIPPHTYLFNPKTNHLFFYTRRNGQITTDTLQ